MSSCAWTIALGIAGAASWSRTSASRYGPDTPSGSAASIADSACPSFIAPPLSSPRVANSCSALRCWTRAATASAGRPPSSHARVRPPIDLHAPRAARRAWPRGAAGFRWACPCRWRPGPLDRAPSPCLSSTRLRRRGPVRPAIRGRPAIARPAAGARPPEQRRGAKLLGAVSGGQRAPSRRQTPGTCVELDRVPSGCVALDLALEPLRLELHVASDHPSEQQPRQAGEGAGLPQHEGHPSSVT